MVYRTVVKRSLILPTYYITFLSRTEVNLCKSPCHCYPVACRKAKKGHVPIAITTRPFRDNDVSLLWNPRVDFIKFFRRFARPRQRAAVESDAGRWERGRLVRKRCRRGHLRSQKDWLHSRQAMICYCEDKESAVHMHRALLLVGLPGFEPGLREPKPLVLPLHHSPIQNQTLFTFAAAKVRKKNELWTLNIENFSFPYIFFVLLWAA